MSRTVNKIVLVGHVGQDPDIQDLGGGEKIAHCSLSTQRGERTDWHRITLRNRLAVFAEEYLKKGSRIYIEGRLEYDSYERDGVCIPTADVVAREIVILDAPKEASL